MHASGNKPLIIAHRGASALAPENTLAAFRKAIEDGAEGIEFDVRIAKDGVPVVFHDSTLRRIGKKEGRTSHFTSDELQSFDVGAWFNGKNPARASREFSGETVPTLDRLFSFLKGYQGRLYLEMKGSLTEISALAEAVAKTLLKTDFLQQTVLKSFKLEAIEKIKRLLPEASTAALFAPKILTLLRRQSRLIERAKDYRADELSLHYSLATEKLVRNARREGMPTTIWTADHPIWVRRAAEIGIHAIITNNPARLLAKRHEILQEA
ncbi:MAG TPA: glycerophosphodiester phosphodiesterase family protein [Pyrinomonadaceae bacterium]|nr:glycerophosphodiester phosphodiesterase family protein [Pyrinomonadaceae bacterium]